MKIENVLVISDCFGENTYLPRIIDYEIIKFNGTLLGSYQLSSWEISYVVEVK
jgi:hypothetical protein